MSRDLAALMASGFGRFMMFRQSLENSGAAGRRGQIGSAMLAVHNLVDGIGIGFSYRVDLATGPLVRSGGCARYRRRAQHRHVAIDLFAYYM